MLNKREALKHEPLDAEACVMVHYGSASLANTRGGGSTATRASPPPPLKGANVGLVRRMGFLQESGRRRHGRGYLLSCFRRLPEPML